MKKLVVKVRVIVMSILSIIISLLLYFMETKDGMLGKEQFLKNQSIRFDKYLLHPSISTAITGFFCLFLYSACTN